MRLSLNAVRFVIEAFVWPFELCHCSRCREVSGSAFVSGIDVRARAFPWVSGEQDARFFEAPALKHAPGYQAAFCCRCGSPSPNLSSVTSEDDWFEIAEELLDEGPGVGPGRYIFVDYAASWDEIMNGRPQCTERDVIKMRKAEWKEKLG